MHHFSLSWLAKLNVISKVARFRQIPLGLLPTGKWTQKKFKRRLVSPTQTAPKSVFSGAVLSFPNFTHNSAAM